MWTPYQIDIILHHHCGRGPFPRNDAPLYGPTVSDLIQEGVLIHDDGGTITTTQLGAALVRMWMETPLPQSAYVDPRTKKVVAYEDG